MDWARQQLRLLICATQFLTRVPTPALKTFDPDWITRSAEVADVLLPSFEDEATHFGDTAPGDTVTRYRALGAATIVVKNGGGDVLVQSDGHAPAHVSPPKVTQVVDSTAAGDAFNAGFLSRWMRKAPLREAAEVGCNVSAQVIRQRGALSRISL